MTRIGESQPRISDCRSSIQLTGVSVLTELPDQAEDWASIPFLFAPDLSVHSDEQTSSTLARSGLQVQTRQVSRKQDLQSWSGFGSLNLQTTRSWPWTRLGSSSYQKPKSFWTTYLSNLVLLPLLDILWQSFLQFCHLNCHYSFEHSNMWLIEQGSLVDRDSGEHCSCSQAGDCRSSKRIRKSVSPFHTCLTMNHLKCKTEIEWGSEYQTPEIQIHVILSVRDLDGKTNKKLDQNCLK